MEEKRGISGSVSPDAWAPRSADISAERQSAFGWKPDSSCPVSLWGLLDVSRGGSTVIRHLEKRELSEHLHINLKNALSCFGSGTNVSLWCHRIKNVQMRPISRLRSSVETYGASCYCLKGWWNLVVRSPAPWLLWETDKTSGTEGQCIYEWRMA